MWIDSFKYGIAVIDLLAFFITNLKLGNLKLGLYGIVRSVVYEAE